MIGSLWQDKSNPNRFWWLLELIDIKHDCYRGFVTDDGITFSYGMISAPMELFYNRIF